MKGMLDDFQVLFLPCCFGTQISLLFMYSTRPSADPVLVVFEFLPVFAATCLPPALSSLTVGFRSDDTHKKDGDALYLQGFCPSMGCFGRRLCCWHILSSVAVRQSSLCGQKSCGLCCCGNDRTASSLQILLEDRSSLLGNKHHVVFLLQADIETTKALWPSLSNSSLETQQ